MSWMRSRFRRSALSVAIAALVVSACAEDPTSATSTKRISAALVSGCSASEAHGPGWVSGGGSGNGEGEIFGALYVDGERYCDDLVWVRLAPVSTLTLPAVYQDSLQPSQDWPLMWEFWDTNAGDGPCSSSPVTSERAHYSPTTGDERHCVRPGTYTFTGPGRSGTRSFDVDYLEAPWSVIDSTSGVTHTNPLVARNTPSGSGQYNDLTINIDLGDSTYSDTPVLDVDTSSAPTTARFKNIASPVGDSSVSWRFSVGRSTVTWNSADSPMNGRGRALARLYKYNGSSWTPLTGYYDYYSEYTNIIRVFKDEFPPPSCPTTTVTYTVGVELMRPDENPSGTPTTTRTFDVTRTCTSVTEPSSLGASSVTSSTATVTWANGTTTSGTTTEVEYNGGGGWASAGSVGAGVTSLGLTGLSASTTYDIRVRHALSGNYSSWTTSSGGLFTTSAVSVTAPSGLGATSVTSTGATITWTNGTTTSGTTTEVELNSGGGWSSAGTPVAAGVTSMGVTGLSPATAYQARVRHSLGGNSSSWVTSSGTLFTTVTEIEITSFTFSCYDHDANSHSYNVISGAWTVASSAGSTAWQVRVTATSSPPTWDPYPLDSGTSGLSGDFGWFRNDGGTPDYRYFWVKYEDNASWYPLGGSVSAIDVADPDLCLALNQRMTLEKALQQFR